MDGVEKEDRDSPVEATWGKARGVYAAGGTLLLHANQDILETSERLQSFTSSTSERRSEIKLIFQELNWLVKVVWGKDYAFLNG